MGSFLASCAVPSPADSAAEADGPLSVWQDEALQLVRKYQTNPLRAARTLAYLHKALYELEVRRRSPGDGDACRNVDSHRLAARVLSRFFPHEVPGRLLAKAHLRAGYDPACDKMDAGQEVFAAIDAQALDDGAFPPRRLRPGPGGAAGRWIATPPTYATNPLEPYAGDWKTFFIGHPSTLVLDPPPDPGSERYRAAVRDIAQARRTLRPEQRRAAEEWHLDAGSVTPPGVWNLKLRSLSAHRELAHGTRLRLAAVLNMAMHDAMVACWHFKYAHWTERPVTAAERLDLGDFAPLLATPSFPAYPSGHACVSATAAEVIAAYLPQHAAVARAWAREAAESRFWGGIHLRFDNEAGLRIGEQVAKAALAAMPPPI